MANKDIATRSVTSMLLNDLFIDKEINPMTIQYAKVLKKRIGKNCPSWITAIANGNIKMADALWVEAVNWFRQYCEELIKER